MSLINSRINEEVQKKIYEITAILGCPPLRISDYLNDVVQVNWLNKDNNSVMWRSNLDSIEIYDGGNIDVIYLDEL